MGKAPYPARGKNPLGSFLVVDGAIAEVTAGADPQAQGILKGPTCFSASPWKYPGLW